MDKVKPKLIETENGWEVTDGWIGEFYFKVAKQPSEATLKKLDMYFLEVAELSIKQNQERKVS